MAEIIPFPLPQLKKRRDAKWSSLRTSLFVLVVCGGFWAGAGCFLFGR